jgi:hypothetical protein
MLRTWKSVIYLSRSDIMSLSVNSSNSDLFSALWGSSSSSSSSSTSGLYSLLGDYSSVRNGSYKKLAKQYYANESSSKSTSSTGTSDEKQTKLAQSSAETTVKSLNALTKSDLYKKVKKTDEDGNTTEDYDKDAILKSLKTFVEDYNSVIENAGDDDNTTVLKNTVRLTNETKVYASALAKAGISIDSDNKLSIDEDAFGKADMQDVKNLFTGSTSFATNTQNELLKVYNAATSALNSSGSIYSSSGVTSASVGSMVDSLYEWIIDFTANKKLIGIPCGLFL